MPKIPSSGATANKTGRALENFIENILINHEYQFVDRNKFESLRYLEQPIYTKQFYLGKTIYDTNFYGDFILYHPEKHPESLVIEAKWQQTKGTVYEKFPYFVLNIKTKSPYKTIVILDGGGYIPQSEVWLRNQVDHKLLHVFNMMEFQTWTNRDNI
jgi:site-specific DNA-adenine methylase